MASLSQQIAILRQALLEEGFVDNEFRELEKFQSKDCPYFMEEIITSYFSESAKTLAAIEKGMEETPCDFSMLDKELQKLKGATSNVGAKKVKNAVIHTREIVSQQNIEGAKTALQQVKQELGTLTTRLEPYFQLLKQA